MAIGVPLMGMLFVSSACSGQATASDPAADPRATVVCGAARFTILTDALVRMEWAPGAAFEDAATLVFLNRRLPVPSFEVDRRDKGVTVRTARLTLHFNDDGKRFHSGNLSVTFALNGRPVEWRPGLKDAGNLGGTVRTLDGVSGACPPEPGLLSRDGWALVDDSRSVLLVGQPPWVQARPERGALDWYLFAHGHEYLTALKDFTRVAGRIPLPPRFAFGSWWSRYWAYSDGELKDLVEQFRRNEVPLDVLVIDMDWHLDGWTGYTWSPKYFPDPDGFLKWVHERGLKATLNLHPADGVHRHERAYADFARHMDVDPAGKTPIPFDCTDRRYMEGYFKLLHHPLEEQGVDFWWIDWQQGSRTKIPHLDPLPWLNHLHWTDMLANPRRGDARPMLFSRWGGLGGHRYQIGFSGDTISNWDSLAFQPYFTATAGNVGFAFWSHDIGGHAPGPVDAELYTRWIQWGALSPALRTHTTKNPQAERRIWAYPDEFFRVARDAFRLRYALIPYLYSAARRTYDDAVPLCRPLYYAWPEEEMAYRSPGAYLLGDDLLVHPVAAPRSGPGGCADARLWLPPGDWTHWFTGRTYRGGHEIAVPTPLEEIPMFVRSGGVIPMSPPSERTSTPVEPLIVHVFPGPRGEHRLYEDDGQTRGYERGEYAWTPIVHHRDGDRHVVRIGPVLGRYAGMAAERSYEVRLRDVLPPRSVRLNGRVVDAARQPQDARWDYDAETLSAVVRTGKQPVRRAIEIEFAFAPGVSDAPLRNGLRGQWSLLRWTMQRLGDASPPALNDALAMRDDLVRDPAAAARVAADFAAVWPTILDAIAKSAVDRDTRAQVLSRLLGLAVRLTVTADAGGAVNARAAVTADPLIPLSAPPACRAVLEAPRDWSASHGGPPAEGTAGTAIVEKLLRPGGGIRTALLGVRAEVECGGATLTVERREVVFPSINAWWVLAPLEPDPANAPEIRFDADLSTDLARAFPGKSNAQVKWKRVVRPMESGATLTNEFFVDLHRACGVPQRDAAAFALAYLRSPEERDAVLALGSDDGVVVWLNGSEVHRAEQPRGYLSRQDRVKVRLRRGMNALLLRIGQGVGGWGFAAHLEDEHGQPLTDVETPEGPPSTR